MFLLLFGITPLLMFNKTSEIFEFNKMIFIYAVSGIIAALWLIRIILGQKVDWKHLPLFLPIAVFFLSQILATFFSIDKHTSLFGYYGRFNGGLLSISTYLFLYFAFINNIGKERIGLLLKTTLFSSTLVMIWGLPGKLGFDLSCYVFVGRLSNDCWTAQFNPSERMFSTLGQPNWLGAYLAINFFLALGYYLESRKEKPNKGKELNLKKQIPAFVGGILAKFSLPKGKRELFYYLYLTICFASVLFTRSRSSLLAIISGLLTIIFFLWHEKKRRIPRTPNLIKKVSFLIISFTVLTLIFRTGIGKVDSLLELKFIRSQKNSAISQSKQIASQSAKSGATESFEIRKIVWFGGLSLIKKYPFFGSGVETFAYSYPQVRPREHNLTSEWDFIYNKAHNEFINYGATTGMVGFVSYIILIGSILHLFYIDLKKDRENQLLLISLLTGFITILITNFFGFSVTTVNLFFYLIPAVAVVLTSQTSKNNDPKILLSKTQKRQLVLPLMILLAVGYFTATYLIADIRYAVAESYQRVQDYSKAANNYRGALMLRNEHIYKDKLSQSLANLAFLSSYAEGQEVNSEKKPAYREQIRTLKEESIHFSQKAIKDSPKNPLYYKSLAKNYFLLYQIDRKQEMFENAVKALDQMQVLSPTDPRIPYTKALFLSSWIDSEKESLKPSRRQGKYREVLELLDHSIALKKNYREAYYLKGLINKKSGNIVEAKKAFQFILNNIDPLDQESKNELEEL